MKTHSPGKGRAVTDKGACLHREAIETTDFGEERRSFLCGDCGQTFTRPRVLISGMIMSTQGVQVKW